MPMRPTEARILLGLREAPTEEELLTAYRAMLRAWHPDRFPQGSDLREVSNQRTRSIIEAFRVLRNELASRQELGDPPEGPGAGTDNSKRPRNPLRFDGPTPEKVIPQEELRPDRTGYRSWAAAAVLIAVLVTTAGLALARGGGPVEAAVLPTGQTNAQVSTESTEREDSRPALEPRPATLPSAPEQPGATRVARYSMAIGAFRDLDRAMTVVERVRLGAPEVWATTVPVAVGESVFHRILVGFTVDQDALAPVTQRVSDVLGEDPDEWILREAGLALCLSEDGSLREARDLMAGLSERGISSFAVRVQSSDGESEVRVCSGSFDDPSEAAYLQGALQRQGFDASLEPRVGEPVL